MESAYTSACQKQGIKPLRQILENLSNESDALVISGDENQITDNDFFGIGHLLKLNPIHLQSLTITNLPLSELSLNCLSEGLESTKHLKHLGLVQVSLSCSKSFIVFLSSIQDSESLESLDLSYNNLDDDSGAYLSCLLESSYPLLSLSLNSNQFKEFSFALPLSKNKALFSFEISNNPLEFTNLISMLEMLTINKTLQHLGLAGMGSKAPAPIKENPSGLLNINEAVTIKLANVLRYSYIASIDIDLDPTCLMQLKELEISISKHNRTLVKLTSALINWNNSNLSLSGISKALKANVWLSDRTQEIPTELEDLISVKLGRKGDNNESFKSSPNKTPNKTLNRKDSWESKISETTIVENKNIKEMSFGKSAISKYLKKDDSLSKFLHNINGKMNDIEEKFTNYSSKTDLYMEKLEQQISASKRGEDLTTITQSIQDIQSKLEKFESEKSAQHNVVDEYIKKLESLKFKEPSEPSSKRSSRRLRSSLRQEKSFTDTFESNRIKDFGDTGHSINSDALRGRILNLEQKIQKLENDSEKINKFDQKLRSTIGKVSRLEGAVQDYIHTPKKVTQGDMQTTQKNKEGFVSLPGDAESVVISALMEKAKNMKANDSHYRGRNPLNSSVEGKRAPSAELRQCLRSRGFTIEGDRPVFRKYRLD